jgi:hypothetical protein
MSSGKTTTRWLLCVLAAAGVGIAACGSGSKGAAATAKLLDVTGTVTVNGQPAAAGRELNTNDRVQVAQGGVARVAYPDGTKVLVVGRSAQGSELAIGATTQEQGLAVMLMKLTKGVLTFVVPSTAKGKSRYEIEAVSSLTVVRGTEGRIEAARESDQKDSIALKTGTVEVLALQGGAKAEVTQGQQVTVGSTGEIGAVEAYDFSKESDLYRTSILMKTISH